MSKKGPLRLRIESFSFTIEAGHLLANGITLHDPQGLLLAKVDKVEATGLDLFRLGERPALVSGNNLYARLELLPSGLPRFLDYLPEPTEEPAQIPFAVKVHNVVVDVLEPAGNLTTLSTANASVDGIGKLWLAQADDIRLKGQGTIRAEARQDENGLELKADLRGAQLLRFMRFFAQTTTGQKIEPLQKLTADRIGGGGFFWLRLQKDKRPEVLANVSVSGDNIRYDNEYKASTGSFVGTVSDEGARGVALATTGGADVRFNGAINWLNETRIAGEAQIKSLSPSDLPASIRQELPKGLSYANGTFRGWIAYSAGQGFRADGRLAASRAVLQNEVVRDPLLSVHVEPDRVAGKVERLVWQGRSIAGAGYYDLNTEQLAAALDAKGVPLKQVAQHFKVKNVGGIADVRLLVSGTLEKPVASLQATGNASASIRQGRTLRLGGFSLLASLVGNTATLERLAIQGPNGALSATGTFDTKTQRMSFDVLSSGIPLQRITPDLSGTLAMSAKIGGSLKDPRLTGRTEIFSAAFKDTLIPAVFADLSLRNNNLIASNVQAIAQGSQATGFLAYNIKNDRVDGRLQARLFLRDLLGETAAGAADVEVSDISGTLSNPTATATANIGKAFIADVELDSATATASINKSGVNLTALNAKVGEGTITGAGVYHFEPQSGSFAGSALAIPIERLTVQVADRVKLEGLIDANQLRAVVGPRGIQSLNAGGFVRNLEINDTLFDGGPWEVSAAESLWKGSAMLGVLERYVQVSEFTFDADRQVLNAEMSALDLDLKPLIAMARPYLLPPQPGQTVKPIVQLSPDAMRRVESLGGLMSAAFTVSGPTDDLAITEGIVDARNLSLEDKLAGNLHTKFTRANDTWNIAELLFSGPLANLNVTGSIDERGQTKLDGELKNLDIEWLGNIDPDLSALAGSVDVSFLVDGPTRRPNITGTLDARLLEEEQIVTDPNSLSPTQLKQRLPTLILSVPFTLTNEPAAADPDAYTLSAEGNVNYRVFRGTLSANVPFDSLYAISETKPWSAAVVALPRELSKADLDTYLPSLDPARTNLKASGELKGQGVGRDYTVSGAMALWKNEAAAPGALALGIREAETAFSTFDANARLTDGALSINVDADSNHGGSLQAKSTLGLGNVSELLSALVSGNSEPLFGRPLSGTVAFSDFGVRERQIYPDPEGDPGSATALINGTVVLGQTLGAPLISVPEGQPLRVSGGDFVLPTLAAATQQTVVPRVVPQFDLVIALAEAARIRAGNVNLLATGRGTIEGTLISPAIDAELEVVSGLVRLPTARVRLEEGGTLHLQYRAREGDDPLARLDVNLTGTTNVTALRFGSVVERYNVFLEMTGDLLSDVPINLRATSDPPDLSSEQIIRLIGQADVLEGLTASVKSSLGDPGVRTAIQTFALPVLFDPITEQLAANLGLDYLAVEYNALEQATITAAKTIGKGLTIQFRRQLFDPPPGQKPRFDLRLTYRLPSRNPLLSRVTFSVGMDQDRPYKIAVEYGTRF